MVVVALGAGFARPADGVPPISNANWASHPLIKSIRAIVDGNEAAIKSDAWKRDERSPCVPPAEETKRVVFRDPAGRVRKYLVEGGSDDSAHRLEHHYDAQGRLRFAFGRAGAANGTIVEDRLYFNEAGGLLWKDRRREGPGYTIPDDWPERYVVLEPERAFAAAVRCR